MLRPRRGRGVALPFAQVGRYVEAAALQEEALDLLRRVLPQGHPKIAASLNNLAITYTEHFGRHKEALALLQAAQGIRRTFLPPDHLDVVNTEATMMEVQRRLGAPLSPRTKRDQLRFRVLLRRREKQLSEQQAAVAASARGADDAAWDLEATLAALGEGRADGAAGAAGAKAKGSAREGGAAPAATNADPGGTGGAKGKGKDKKKKKKKTKKKK